MLPQARSVVDHFNNFANAETPNSSQNMALQTPISQMMQLKHWVEEVQRSVQLDAGHGFLASLGGLVPLEKDISEENRSSKLQEIGG